MIATGRVGLRINPELDSSLAGFHHFILTPWRISYPFPPQNVILAGHLFSRKKSLENLAAYLIRSSFSQRRMEYLSQQAKVLYQSKDGQEKKTYSALEWLAAMGRHVPDHGQQCVRYYDFYANSTRGRLRKRQLADPIPTVLEPANE